jgi:hypothetical protein
MIAGGLEFGYVSLHAQQARVPDVSIGSTDVGGVVTSSKGPEAGVWVIAEAHRKFKAHGRCIGGSAVSHT